MVLARIQLDRRLDARLSPSDLVQQALLAAHAARADLRAQTPPERLAWLRRILANCIQKARRDLCRDKRDARRECSLEAALEQSSLRLGRCLAGKGPSPSAGLQSEERLLQVASAILALPEAQRDAVILKYFQGLSQDEIGESRADRIRGRRPKALLLNR
jgi:RNA polymerase sigma-70 factor (ECF subfamily)